MLGKGDERKRPRKLREVEMVGEVDKSFGIHWENNKTTASTTKYDREPHETVNRSDMVVILSQLYCVQRWLRNGGPAKLAESSADKLLTLVFQISECCRIGSGGAQPDAVLDLGCR